MFKEKAAKDLMAIVSNDARKSWLQANKKKDGTFYKKHRPYSLTDEGLKANRYIKALTTKEITNQEEEEIKAFLLSYRLLQRDMLVNTDPRLN